MTDHDLAPLADGEVIVSSSYNRDNRIYHTDPDCRYAGDVKAPKVRQRDSLGDDWDECRNCAGAISHQSWSDFSAYTAASQTDPEEVFDDD